MQIPPIPQQETLVRLTQMLAQRVAGQPLAHHQNLHEKSHAAIHATAATPDGREADDE